jgi:hypothetical protein
MAVCDANQLLHRPEISLLDPDGNLLKTCVLDAWSDTLRLDPLTGKFLVNRPSPGGTQMVDMSTCARVLRSDSLGVDDEGRFAPGGGDFGNQYFSPVGAWSAGISTQVPVPYTDPDQSVPERAVKFLSGVPLADGTSFDRDGKHLVVTDRYTGAVITIHRIPGYAPPSPAASLSPTNLTFNDQHLGTTSAPQVATLSNAGSASLTIASITAMGDFTQLDTCGSEVAAGGNCTISVSFTPMAPGIRSGYIVITDSASAQPHVIALTGTGIGPAVSFSVASLDFGEQHVGSPSAPQTVTLFNTGNALLTIASIAASGDFSQTNACGTSVLAGGNCLITVDFTPTTTGIRTGALTVTDNALSSPHTVVLSGLGLSPVAVNSPSSLDFPSLRVGTTSTAQAVTLSNTGNMPLTITSVTASGDFAQTNTCGNSVAAGASCTISVAFTPTAGGTRNGAITINDDSLDSPQVVTLAGVGQDFKVGSYITERTITA